MSQELGEEVISLNAIYGNGTLVQLGDDPQIYILALPSQPAISLRIDFPTQYPDVPPSILGTESVGSDVVKGEGTDLVEHIRRVLAEIYIPGAPCIFDLIEETKSHVQQLASENSTASEVHQTDETDSGIYASKWNTAILDEEPPWTLSEAVTEKKSTFIARSAPVVSVDQAKQYVAHLMAADKKVAKATHNITAWRIRGDNGVQYQDCDDDGETAAGGRLLHLLELMGVWNAMVVVTRWYGGVHLGPDRFRIINQTAREALLKGASAEDGKHDTDNRRAKR